MACTAASMRCIREHVTISNRLAPRAPPCARLAVRIAAGRSAPPPPNAASTTVTEGLSLTALAALLSPVLYPASAIAADAAAYNPAGGEEFLKNVSGALYVVLVAYFAFRVLTKRAKRATEEKLAGQDDGLSLKKLIPGALHEAPLHSFATRTFHPWNSRPQKRCPKCTLNAFMCSSRRLSLLRACNARESAHNTAGSAGSCSNRAAQPLQKTIGCHVNRLSLFTYPR